jgi:hypothetical protein
MPQSKEELMTPLEANNLYLGYGNLRPPLPQLLAIDAALEASKYPADHTTRADVLMDSALRAPEYGEVFLNAAYALLESNSDRLLDRATADGDGSGSFTKVNRLTECLFKLSLEQPWRQAVQGEPVEFDYPLMLNTARRANQFITDASWDKGIMADYTPLLLLARSQDSTKQDGPIGRLALTREDRRSSVARPYPPYSHWKLGVSGLSDATSFIDPDYRVNVRWKMPNLELTKKVNAAGIVLLSAFQHYFADSNALISGCLVEQGLSPIDDSRPLKPAQLNRITATILEDIQEQSAHIEQQEAKRREQDELSAAESSTC